MERAEIDLATARALPEAALHKNGHESAEDSPPPLFSRPFVEVVGLALEQGCLSARRAVDLLGLTVDDLADLFATHEIDIPSTLRET